MSDAGGIAVTVRRDRHSPNRWAVQGAEAEQNGDG